MLPLPDKSFLPGPKRVSVDRPSVGALATFLLDQPIRVERSYIERPDGNAFRVPAGDYLTDYKWFAERSLMCPETPARGIPAEMLDRLAAAAGTSASEAVVLLHLGFPGSTSPIHFDWDFRTVLHVNLKGQKSFQVAPPDGASALPTVINSLPFDLSRLSPRQQRYLFQLVGSQAFSLSAGDGVIFPPLWWHAAVYRRPSLSVSFRFDEVKPLRPIAALPRSARLQRIAWLLQTGLELPAGAIVSEIVTLFFKPAAHWRHRYRRFARDLDRIDAEVRERLHLPPLRLAIPAHLEGEIGAASSELKRLYGWVGPKGLSDGDAELEGARSYLFDAAPIPLPKEAQMQLAAYAIAMRQGLRPLGVAVASPSHA